MNSMIALSAAALAAFLSLAPGQGAAVGHWERPAAFTWFR